MLDKKAFQALSCGLCIVASEYQGKKAACVVNTLIQITSRPLRVLFTLNKENYTSQLIRNSKTLSAVVLSEETPLETIGLFGFQSSKKTDKFSECKFSYDIKGNPFIDDSIAARFCLVLSEVHDVGTHDLFICDVVEAEYFPGQKAMTYDYYHRIKGGTTPKKASSFIDEEVIDKQTEKFATGPLLHPSESIVEASENKTLRIGWRCKVCGYIEWVDELPDDYRCPICGVGKDKFELYTKYELE